MDFQKLDLEQKHPTLYQDILPQMLLFRTESRRILADYLDHNLDSTDTLQNQTYLEKE